MPTLAQKKIVFYVSPDVAQTLATRKKRWGVPTSVFVNFCVGDWLRREADADAKGLFSDSPNTKFPPITIAQQKAGE